MIIECTKDNPWNGKRDSRDRVRHHEVEEVGEQIDGWPSGDIVTWKCKNCGHQWKEELLQ